MSKKQVRVYVAGPYSKGDVAINVRKAVFAADRLRNARFAPFLPHLTHFWHMLAPRPYEDWLDLDNQFIPCCDALLRLPGDSSGADKEVALAHSLRIPVFYTQEELQRHEIKGYFNE
jgi:hypothetical protein